MRVRNGAVNIVDQLERLCEDEAIEHVGRHGVCGAEIGDDRRLRIRGSDVEYIPMLNADAESFRIRAVSDLQDATTDIVPVLLQELLNVVAVDRRAAVESPRVAERGRPSKSTQPGGIRQPAETILQSLPSKRGHLVKQHSQRARRHDALERKGPAAAGQG